MYVRLTAFAGWTLYWLAAAALVLAINFRWTA